MKSNAIAFCLAEDRLSGETGLRLAILSLHKHCPDTAVYVYRPSLNSTFAEWVRQFSQVTWIADRPEGGESWNCKPNALMPLLAKGYREVVWLDSDILITRDCRPLFSMLGDRVLGVAQEPSSLPDQGTSVRTRGWDWKVGRCLPFTLNSSVVRVTSQHLPLLERWRKCLADPKYILAQKLPLEQRPLHLMGDQDILNALLGTRQFADIPLQVFKSGDLIVHAGGALGYSLSERLCGLWKGKPVFVHATAGKPWLWLGGEAYWSQPTFFSWHRRLLQELSPYLAESRQYQGQLGEDVGWMDRNTVTGSMLRVLGLGHYALRGLPVTLAASILVNGRRLARTISRRNDQSLLVPRDTQPGVKW